MSPTWRTQLAVLLAVLAVMGHAAPQKVNKHKTSGQASTSAAAPAHEESSAAMASHIVQELKSLAQRHKLPAVLHDVTNQITYGADQDYFDHEIYKLEEETTPDPAVSPAGYNVKGVFALVEYLILLILLKGSLNHVADKYYKSRGRRDEASRGASQLDLVGLAEQMQHHMSISQDLDHILADVNKSHVKHQHHKTTDKRNKRHR